MSLSGITAQVHALKRGNIRSQLVASPHKAHPCLPDQTLKSGVRVELIGTLLTVMLFK